MKTTIDLPDELLDRVKGVASREKRTLRSLVIEGLRFVLASHRARTERFVLRDAGVAGRGIRDDLSEGDWGRIRDLIYRGRGG